MIPMTQPITAAYEQTDALDVACDHCGAPVGQFCTDPRTDRLRRVPCVVRASRCADRCRDNDEDPMWLDSSIGSDAAERDSAPLDHPQLLDYPDPSEPRHRREDDE